MKFVINNRNWEIKELSQEQIRKEIKRHDNIEIEKSGKFFGVTYADEQVILLDKDLHIETKKHTLKHELAHCFLNVYCFHQQNSYTEEDMADIVANSNDFINEIMNKYFKAVKNMACKTKKKGGKNK